MQGSSEAMDRELISKASTNNGSHSIFETTQKITEDENALFSLQRWFCCGEVFKMMDFFFMNKNSGSLPSNLLYSSLRISSQSMILFRLSTWVEVIRNQIEVTYGTPNLFRLQPLLAPPKTGGSWRTPMVVRFDKVVSCNKTGGPWGEDVRKSSGFVDANFFQSQKRDATAIKWFLDGIQTTYFRSVIIKLFLFTRNTSMSSLLPLGGLGFERKVHDKTVKQLR